MSAASPEPMSRRLSTLLIRLGLLAADHPEIRQLEINSLLVDADGTRALDARLRIAPAQSTEG